MQQGARDYPPPTLHGDQKTRIVPSADVNASSLFKFLFKP